MAQPLIRRLVGDLAATMTLPDPVVEFGALQVEPGQDGDLRPLFAGRDFVGTDLRAGPGVDRVEDLRALSFADGEVGTALCLDTLEHCADPPQACRELVRVTSGVCVISSVMLFGIHGYPSDYFRFTPEGFRAMLGGFAHVQVAGIGHPDLPVVVVGVGSHDTPLGVPLAELPSLREAQKRFEARPGLVRFGVQNYPPGALVRALGRELPRLARERLRRA